eukprot:CAMPEP_0172489778 /NCGR_PEP_ID=MMETSP1066-20121228/19993_1 /TAXON_ID=671091 /ORGANISM="Coscinodiscus wailesii, Strain CCMP2513" /LENGTH=316 /DNA_ID=CAMNT_0013257879 /DNA_START=76 /DNA_END=1026 /DNA_ORIENTATION=+
MSNSNSTLIATTAAAIGVTIGYIAATTFTKTPQPTPTDEKTTTAPPTRPPAFTTGPPAKEGQRKYLIGGNWKCNGDTPQATSLIKMLNDAGPIPANVEVVVAPVAIHSHLALSSLRSDVAVAVQNCGVNGKRGAYTGEVCADQLLDSGITWVIIGHSERREGFDMAGEDDELVAKKVKTAVDAGLNVMFCIGEKKEEREKGITMDVCARQMAPAAKLLTESDWSKVAIAYEPVWAIGTGLTATPAMAQETHKSVREWVAKNVSAAVAEQIRIQYGGSMKGANAAGLLCQPDIDGGLIGSASLKEDFIKIINACPKP